MRMLYLINPNQLLQIRTLKCQLEVQSAALSSFLVVFVLLLLSSCGRFQDPINRPSPLTSDTLKFGQHQLSITYSSPRVRNREIWNSLVPFHKVWRSGANEATVFETNTDLVLSNQLLPKGKYALFTIPSEDSWTIIFNKDWDQWGAYGYDSTKDQLRISVVPNLSYPTQEELSFKLKENVLEFRWGNLGYRIPFEPAN